MFVFPSGFALKIFLKILIEGQLLESIVSQFLLNITGCLLNSFSRTLRFQTCDWYVTFFNTTAHNFPLDMDYSCPACPPHKDLSDILAEHRYRRSRERLGPQKLFYKWHLQNSYTAVILNEKWFWPSRGHWWYLETIFFIVPTGKWGATGMSWMETGVVLNIHPTAQGNVPQQRTVWPNVNNGEVETPCFKIICKQGTSLVVQQLTLDLPMQGVWAWSLVRS